MKDKIKAKPDSGLPPPMANLQEGASVTEECKTYDLVIAGIGASAGGLDALQKLLLGLPAEIGAVADITERKRVSEALAASETKPRVLLDTANSTIIRWDNQGVIRYINEYGFGFFGYPAEEQLDRDVMTIVPRIEKSSGRDLDALVKGVVIHPKPWKSRVTKDLI